LHYAPGSFKARLAVDGWQQMTAFCRDHGVPFEVCGKIVVASSVEEVPRLRALHERGTSNGLAGLAWLEPAQIREHEPHAAGVAGLRVPGEGVVSFPAVCDALVRAIEGLGGRVLTGAAVHGLVRADGAWVVETGRGELRADFLVNCAGLHADRIVGLTGERPPLRIVPFRGDYYEVRPERTGLVRHLIYPVPDPAFPFLGVHLTRTVAGRVLAGPTAVLAFAREGYRRSTVSVRDLADAIGFPGLWRFLARYPGQSVREVWRSLSRERVGRALRRLVPELRGRDLVPAPAGVRAQAMLPTGELVNDFAFVARDNALHVLNAPSPAATASLAIGDEIVRRCGFARQAVHACAS
jgi:L-2-hydroxyglutarate oxidase